MFERFRLFRQQTQELKIGEVKDFLSERFRQERQDIESKLVSGAHEIRTNFSYVKSISEQLKSKSSPNRYANILKDKFCNKAIQAVDGIGQAENNYAGMQAFMQQSREAIATIGSMGLKEFRHLHAFRDDMTRIAEKIKAIEASINSCTKMLQDSAFIKSESLKGGIDSILDAEKKIADAQSEIVQMESALQPIQDFILAERKKAEGLRSRLSQYREERVYVTEMEKSMSDIKQQVDNEFSGMDRIMKKFVYFGELGKEETRMLKEYIKEPGNAFLNLDKTNFIRRILDAMFDYKDKPMIGLDERRFEKLKDLIRQFDFLVEIRVHYRDLKQRKEEKEAEIIRKSDPVTNEIKSVEAEISAKEREASSIKSRIEEKHSEKKLLEKRVLDTRGRIELEMSSLLGNQFRLV